MDDKKGKSKIAEIRERGLKKLEEREKDPEFIKAREEWEKIRNDRIAGVVREIKQDITGKPEPPKQLQLFSPLPDDICRTSPFFPMNKRDMNLENRPFERGLTWETSWGRITITGLRLSIYDETILLTILQLMKKHNADLVETTRHEICQVAGIQKGKNTYNAIWESIKRLTGTRIDLEKWTDKNRKDTKPVMTNTILSGGITQNEKIQVKVNPYFREMFVEGMITNIDIEFRNHLKTDTAKAIYRFLQSQKPFYQKNKYEIHLLKLCKAINIETPQLFKLRESVRRGLRELRKQGYLKQWQVSKQDIVTVWKGKNTTLTIKDG
jgi:hypothetical protein